MKRKIISGITLCAVAGLLILFASPSYKQGQASPAGSEAKPFTFEIGGKQMQLSDLRGKIVVLNFWATWCPPCVEETPSLVALQRRIESQGGMVLGVSVDEDADAYARFIQQNAIDFPTYRDPSKKIADEYGTFVYPETYIIGRDGSIVRKLIGAQDWTSPEMQAYFHSLLRSNATR